MIITIKQYDFDQIIKKSKNYIISPLSMKYFNEYYEILYCKNFIVINIYNIILFSKDIYYKSKKGYTIQYKNSEINKILVSRYDYSI